MASSAMGRRGRVVRLHSSRSLSAMGSLALDLQFIPKFVLLGRREWQGRQTSRKASLSESTTTLCANPELAALPLANLLGYQLGQLVVHFRDSISSLPQMTVVSSKPSSETRRECPLLNIARLTSDGTQLLSDDPAKKKVKAPYRNYLACPVCFCSAR